MSRPVPEIRGKLLKIGDTQLAFTHVADDIRNNKVFDINGDEIGVVDEIFIDDVDNKVRFIEIGSGGFLGLGKTKFLLPVDAIAKVVGDRVYISHTREKVAGAPVYNPDLVVEDIVHPTVKHYGHRPYWDTGYVYPSYPRYPEDAE